MGEKEAGAGDKQRQEAWMRDKEEMAGTDEDGGSLWVGESREKREQICMSG